MSAGCGGEEMINEGRSICIFPLDLILSHVELRPREGPSARARPATRGLRGSFMWGGRGRGQSR